VIKVKEINISNGLKVFKNNKDINSIIRKLNDRNSIILIESDSMEYIHENKRIYHAYNKGKYILLNDKYKKKHINL